MVTRITTGKSFAGASRYQFAAQRDQPADKQAEILAADPAKKIRKQSKAFDK